MGLAEGHRHIDVMRTSAETSIEDRLIQSRVAGIDHDVRLGGFDESDDVGLTAGVDLGGDEPSGVIEFGDCSLCRFDGDVCECERLEEGTCFCDLSHRRSHAACTYHQDVHDYPFGERSEYEAWR